MSHDTTVLRKSLELVVSREPPLVQRFYEVLFRRHPEVRPMFNRSPLDRQQRMLHEAVLAAVDHIDDAAWLEKTLGALGARHVHYGVTPEMYRWVGACLLETLAEIAGTAWSPEVERVWADAYGAISRMMLDGCKNATK